MELEQQVCNSELALKLKELGVKQDSQYYWIKSINPKGKYHLAFTHGFNHYYHQDDMISAFTLAELGELFPCPIKLFTELFKSLVNNKNSGASLNIQFDENISPIFCSENETNCRAQAIIYLLENHFFSLCAEPK